MTPLFDLTGRTAVIIGAGSTLGSVMAEALSCPWRASRSRSP